MHVKSARFAQKPVIVWLLYLTVTKHDVSHVILTIWLGCGYTEANNRKLKIWFAFVYD